VQAQLNICVNLPDHAGNVL
jgi:hypothetical protein